MALFDLAQLEAAAELVHAVMPPTPQYAWPLLCARAGAEVWLKHENHTPAGAFKLRGGLVYLDDLGRRRGAAHRRARGGGPAVLVPWSITLGHGAAFSWTRRLGILRSGSPWRG